MTKMAQRKREGKLTLHVTMKEMEEEGMKMAQRKGNGNTTHFFHRHHRQKKMLHQPHHLKVS
jgi:hypothetical protein